MQSICLGSSSSAVGTVLSSGPLPFQAEFCSVLIFIPCSIGRKNLRKAVAIAFRRRRSCDVFRPAPAAPLDASSPVSVSLVDCHPELL